MTEAQPDQILRRTSKRAWIVALLRREQGASVEVLTKATGWLPHSTRAALAALRKAGYQLAHSKDEAGTTVYRLSAPAAEERALADADAATAERSRCMLPRISPPSRTQHLRPRPSPLGARPRPRQLYSLDLGAACAPAGASACDPPRPRP